MNPKKIWCNLAVSDLDRTTKFYTELGFRSNGSSKELTSFLVGENNFIMHFFLKDILKTNVKMEIADSHNVNEVIFTLSAESKQEADVWAKEVERAGGKIISLPEEFGAGYYGFIFADPDGHRFNVFYMQGFKSTCIWEPLNTWEKIFERDGKSNELIKLFDEFSVNLK